MCDWNEIFEYSDGELYWKVRLSPRGLIGAMAGSRKSDGYKHVQVFGKKRMTHRIIWEMFNGPIPEGMQIDHISDTRDDNRLENLQLLSQSANKSKQALNVNASKRSSSGRRGVVWNSINENWRVWIHQNKVRTNLGHYNSLLDAVAARMRAEREL